MWVKLQHPPDDNDNFFLGRAQIYTCCNSMLIVLSKTKTKQKKKEKKKEKVTGAQFEQI